MFIGFFHTHKYLVNQIVSANIFAIIKGKGIFKILAKNVEKNKNHPFK